MSTGGAYRTHRRRRDLARRRNRGISAYFMPDPRPRVRPVRAQGRPRRAEPGPLCMRRTTAASTARTTTARRGLHRRRAADRLRVHGPRPPAPRRRLWLVPVVSDGERIPPDGHSRCSTPTTPARVDAPRRPGCPARATRASCATPPVPTAPTERGSTSAPATATSSRRPTRARRSSGSRRSCPTCSSCGRPSSAVTTVYRPLPSGSSSRACSATSSAASATMRRRSPTAAPTVGRSSTGLSNAGRGCSTAGPRRARRDPAARQGLRQR